MHGHMNVKNMLYSQCEWSYSNNENKFEMASLISRMKHILKHKSYNRRKPARWHHGWRTLCEDSFEVLYQHLLVRLQNSVTPFQSLQNLISLRTLSYKRQGVSIRNSTLTKISPLECPFPFFRTLASPTFGIIHYSDILHRPHLQQYLKTQHFKDRTAPVQSSVNTYCQMDPKDKAIRGSD
jgi:hypothetical protein